MNLTTCPLFDPTKIKRKTTMWIIEALTVFGELNLAPIAITGATGIIATVGALLYFEKKKKGEPVAPETMKAEEVTA